MDENDRGSVRPPLGVRLRVTVDRVVVGLAQIVACAVTALALDRLSASGVLWSLEGHSFKRTFSCK
jgi:hypothetical protein